MSSYCHKLKCAVEKSRVRKSDEERKDADSLLKEITSQFEEVLRRMKIDGDVLEKVCRYWEEFDRVMESTLPWLVKAETLLKDGERRKCEVNK